MPTFDKSFKKFHSGGIIRKSVSGLFYAEYNRDNKRPREPFATLEGAKKRLDEVAKAREEKGAVVTALSARQLNDAFDAFEMLKDSGHADKKLSAVVEHYLKHFEPEQDAGEVGTVKSWYDTYIDYLANPDDGGDAARPRTITDKRQRLKSFLEIHGEQDVSEITKENVESWLKFTGASRRDLLNYKTSMQALFNFIERRCIEQNKQFKNTVAIYRQRKKKEVPPAECYTPADAEKLLRALENMKDDGRSALVLVLGLFAGLRTAEITENEGLKFDAIDFTANRIRIPASQTKTRRMRDVDMANMPNLVAWLKRYAFSDDGQRKKGRIAPAKNTFWARKKRALSAAGVQSVDNGARHSFGTFYGLLHGYRDAAELMGHIGGMKVFEEHYKGTAEVSDAEQFFEIMPTPAKASKVIKFKVAK